MKCPTCNKGEVRRIKSIIKQDGIEFETFRCNSCGEEIMDMKQLKVLAQKYMEDYGN